MTMIKRSHPVRKYVLFGQWLKEGGGAVEIRKMFAYNSKNILEQLKSLKKYIIKIKCKAFCKISFINKQNKTYFWKDNIIYNKLKAQEKKVDGVMEGIKKKKIFPH